MGLTPQLADFGFAQAGCSSSSSACSHTTSQRLEGFDLIDIALTFVALAVAGGLLAGAWAGFRPRSDPGPGKAFLVWLGLVVVVSTTFAKSTEALPFALIWASALGIVPFWCFYVVLRALVNRVRAKR